LLLISIKKINEIIITGSFPVPRFLIEAGRLGVGGTTSPIHKPTTLHEHALLEVSKNEIGK
jgi:hypothetical protein